MADTYCSLAGNLTRDPELQFTQSGQARCTFTIAVTGRKKVDGEWVDGDPQYYPVVCWGPMGQHTADSVGKGARVVVTGILQQRSWETNDGDKRSSIEVKADEVAVSMRWEAVQCSRGPAGAGSAPIGGGNSGDDWGDEPHF